MHPRIAFTLACALPAAAFANSEWISLPLAQVSAPQLPAAPLGSGNWRFEVQPGWAKLPEGTGYGSTHGGVAVSKTGNIFVSSDTKGVFVFAPDGTLLRNIAPEQTNLHGLMIREEGGREFIYGACNNGAKAVKLTLDGNLEWEITVPRESGKYAAPEDAKKKGAVNFKPTGIAIGPDGRIYIADGYGASVIHIYSPDRKYLKTIGTRGEGEGQFKVCHGIAIDNRYGKPRLLVADRENHRLVHLDLDGNWIGVLATEMRRPCSFSFSGNYVAVAELEGRVAITDKAGKVVATLGDNPDKKQWAAYKLEPQFWQDGIFIAPHGCAFDKDGNLFVEDWNFTGRLTKLKRVGKKA